MGLKGNSGGLAGRGYFEPGCLGGGGGGGLFFLGFGFVVSITSLMF